MSSKDVNHELENYSDKEILAEYEYRRLGKPYTDEIMITAFKDNTILSELIRRNYQMPDINLRRLLDSSIGRDLAEMAVCVRNFLYNSTGKLFKVEIA